MKVDAGNVLYDLGQPPCTGVGLEWSNEELNAALDDRVATVLFDDEGKNNIGNIFAGLAETGFVQDSLKRLLENPDKVENWRVGEAIALAYLSDHRSCCFPWPNERSQKKRGSSLPGADLVGFGIDDSGDCFAFGEVKTSSEKKYPPGIMYGPTGLKRQMEDLRDNLATRDDLVKYLGHHAISTPWLHRFRTATARYLQNSSDVHIFGFLVRDVEPNQNDLGSRVKALDKGCPDGMCIELFALYLPQGTIDRIGERMISGRAGAY
ncbi:MAG: hypothetical protein OXF73_00515 [Gammaproteobacteria bacterium]|nr:hypothetical protein [Gammaproteobacteria bacterium]MCY4227563.1 hypothetical protein [Gammaproteobacteria bacterium]